MTATEPAIPFAEVVPGPAAAPPRPNGRPAVGPVRRLAESLVLFVCAILFLRTMAVEPFGVPTGSMAPALHGNHKCVPCPRCGYPVRVGAPPPRHTTELFCPNCEQGRLDDAEAVEVAGDRLLVDKNVYQLRPPRRWELAVFRCPCDLTKPYVKRVVGLPNERFELIDGDAYADGELLRKTFAQCRETRIPIFDADFVPLPHGWKNRLQSEVAGEDGRDPDWFKLAGGELKLDARAAVKEPVWTAYRHCARTTTPARRGCSSMPSPTTATARWPPTPRSTTSPSNSKPKSRTGRATCTSA